MPEEPKVPAATPAPAAPATPATPAPAAPASPATPATPAAPAPATPDPKAASKTGEKSLLDQAGDEGKQSDPGASLAPQALIDAVEKWQADPSPENFEAAKKALADAKAAAANPPATPNAVSVPEKYEFKMPDGVEMDENAAKAFEPVLKEAKISQEQLNAILPVYAAQVQTLVKTSNEAAIADYEAQQNKNYQDVIQGFRDETMKALGPNWKAELADAAKIKERHFSKETMELLTRSGAGDNIHFLRDLMRLGKMISPDKLIEGANKEEPSGTAKKLFPNNA